MTKVEFKEVTKVFGNIKKRHNVALDRISFIIPENDFFGILGASGSGKTTALRLIAGLDTPTSGSVEFDGRTYAKDGKAYVEAEDRDVAMVFQNWGLYPNLTNYENIAFPLRAHRWDQDRIDKRVRGLADTLGISETLQSKPGQISGGQQQRVSVARALAKNPRLLLLDEPFSNLDAGARDDARSLVKRLRDEIEVTTVIVSHDPADIFSLTRQAIVLLHGKLVQSGSPKEIYDLPKNSQIAKAMGEINLIRGTYESKGNKIFLRLSDKLSLDITGTNTDARPKNVADGSQVLIGIRPEDLQLYDSPNDAGFRDGNNWRELGTFRTLISSYTMGSFNITLSGYGMEKTIISSSRRPIETGTEVMVSVNTSKIKIFQVE